VRPFLTLTVVLAAGLLLAACGTEKISVASTDPDYQGAELFSQRCGGCHTLSPAGTQGSDARSIRSQGPNLDQRDETMNDVLFAIRNGGYSGAIMPQNIVTGSDAEKVAAFVSKYAGKQSVSSARPGQTNSAP
jgi:mono/diheme cytochrome c family protein